jgi:hypothetical protein
LEANGQALECEHAEHAKYALLKGTATLRSYNSH